MESTFPNWNLIKFAEESSSFGENINLDDIVQRRKRFDTNGLFHINSAGVEWRANIKHMHDWELMLQLANKYPKGFIHIPLSLVKYFSRYGRDGRCANASYKEWQDCYKAILENHKDSNLRPSDEWFAEKIKKYDNLIVNGNGQDIHHRIKSIFK